MTPTSFKRAAYGLIGLSLAFVFLIVPQPHSGTPAAAGAAVPLASPTPNASNKPTLQRYNCDSPESPDYITFNWTATRPNGGWVGEVNYGGATTLVQAYDVKFADPAHPDQKMLNWAFQAQNGSFVCRMNVNSKLPILRNGSVEFQTCNNNNWPLLFCSVKGS